MGIAMKTSLKLIPYPKKITYSGKDFKWQSGDRLMLAPESGAGDFDALTVLADAIGKNGSPRPLLDRSSSEQNPRRGLHLRYRIKSKHGEEGYLLRVSDKGVELEAGTATGIFYGIQTLRQIARSCKGSWPGLIIEDKPALKYRGLSISMSQGIMARPETIAEWIGHLSLFKLNVLQLNMDGGFQFASHPDIDADMVCYKPEDFLKLDSLCAKHHIDFQPSFNSFGHAGGHLLALPQYRKMAESKAACSFCPDDPRTYDFLEDIYADYLPLFRSKYFNAGCDEVYDLGIGRSRKTAEKIGVGALFANHVIKLQKSAARYGKRIQIWSDMIRQIPEILESLPKDIIILNWIYNSQGVRENPWIFEATQLFRSKGFDVWGAPGVHNWGSLMTRHQNAVQNIRDQVAATIKHGGSGLLNTDWNELGPPRLPGTGFHGFVFGAAESWSPGALGDEEFDEAFSFLGFGDPSGKAMNAISTIGKYMNNDTPSETTMTYDYLRNPFPSRPRHMRINPSSDYFDHMVTDISKVKDDFSRIVPSCFHKALTLGGQMAWLGARKARLDAGWYGVGTHITKSEMKKEAEKLAQDVRSGIRDLRKTWPEIATPDNFEKFIDSLSKIAKSLESARFDLPVKKENDNANLDRACVPDLRSCGMSVLSDNRHLERFPPLSSQDER